MIMCNTKCWHIASGVLLILGTLVCHAGTVLWDGALLRDDAYNCDYTIWWWDDDWVSDSYHLRLDYNLDVTSSDGLVTVTFLPHENLGGGGDWAVSSMGAMADESTTRHLDAFLFDGGLDGSNGGVHSDYPLVVSADGEQSAYLAFAYSNINFDPIFNPTVAPVFYGWLELAINGKNLSIVHSAIDISGDPLVVGLLPVPEPGTFCLCVIGACVLSLMRHRRNMR